MLDIGLSLLPVFTLIALGAGLRRIGLIDAGAWAGLERLTYFVLFPPLLFTSIAAGSFAGAAAAGLAVAFVAAVAVMATLMLVARPALGLSGPAFSSVFQAGLRWNGYVALGVISALLGEAGLALAAVGFAVLVPVNNLLSVVVISRYAGAAPAPLAGVLRALAGNPLIIACALALAVVASGLEPPAPMMETLRLLGQATVALGLICVGAALDFPALRAARYPLALGSALRLLAMPATMWATCAAVGVEGDGLVIALVCAASPVATSAYILARQLGGDAGLMANIITVTTLASLVTLPLIALAGRAMGG
jgi:hypothetical protein